MLKSFVNQVIGVDLRLVLITNGVTSLYREYTYIIYFLYGCFSSYVSYLYFLLFSPFSGLWEGYFPFSFIVSKNSVLFYSI